MQDKPKRREPKPTNAVYVGGFKFGHPDERATKLREWFGKCGEITQVDVPRRSKDWSWDFGFIHFTTIEAATAATQMHATVIDGEKLSVQYRRPQRSRRGPTDKYDDADTIYPWTR